MNHSARLYILLFSLYWAQGLPVGFMTHALPIILRMQNVSLTLIGGFGLLMVPWSLKILWAPFIDRMGRAGTAHYRSWIIPLQLISVIILLVLSFYNLNELNHLPSLLIFFSLLFLLNLAGATQDIATDGLAVHVLKTHQQHWGNTFQVIGSRLGFIVGGGAVLWALDWLSWQVTFWVLAALVLLNTLPILFYQPRHTVLPKAVKMRSTSFSIRLYFTHFTQSRELKYWLLVLLTIKIADGLSGAILKPLLVDLGLNFTQLGVYITMFGALAALVGAALAGYLLKYFSRSTLLLTFSYFKIISFIGYFGLAYAHEHAFAVPFLVVYGVNAMEDAFSAMLLVVILTLVMQYCRQDLAGTDFTFQVAIMTTVSGGLYLMSGILGDYLGYKNYLIFIIVMAFIMMMPLHLWKNIQIPKNESI